MFGKADPYSRMRIGVQEFSTKPNPGGGKNPIWNEEFVFDISNEREMEIEVLDKETVGNDKFMGKCKVSIMEWIANGKFDGDIDIEDKAGKNVGRISVSVKFDRPNSMNKDNDNKENQVVSYQGNNNQMENMPPRDPSGKFTDEEILEAFKAFDLDKNNFIGASEIRHVLINIGEQVTDEEVYSVYICTFIYMYLYIHSQMKRYIIYICMFTFVYICRHVYMHIYICIFTCIYMYIG
jgi:hypothetical protein